MSNLENLPRPTVNLSGTDGNAFALLGKMRVALKKAGWKSDQIDAFFKEATAGDYDHVLQTCMKYAEVD